MTISLTKVQEVRSVPNCVTLSIDIHVEFPSRVDGKRRYLARDSDFVSWDEACRVPKHKVPLRRSVCMYLY